MSGYIMTTSSQCNSNNSRLSSDSGIYVPLEIPFSDLEETVNDKENTKSLAVTFQDKDNKVAKKEDKYKDVNVVTNSNPGLGLVGWTTLVSPEVGSASRSHIPPPVPPQYLKPKFKAPREDNKLLDTCEKTPLLSGASGSNQRSHFISGEELNTAVDANDSNTNLALLPHEAPEQRHEPKMSDTEEKRRTEWEAKEKDKDKTTCQQQNPLEKNKMAESNEDITVTERSQDVGKRAARRETLVIFNNEVLCEEGDQQVELEAGWLTHLLMTENLSESTDDDSDFSSEEEQDVSKGNAEPVSAEPQPEPLPSKILKKCPPKLPVKPPGLCYATRPDVEEKEESTKKEEDEQQGKEERCEHVTGSTPPGHGQTTQRNHKKQSRSMQKFTKIIDRLRENREVKKKMKAGEMTMDQGREQDAEVWEKENCKEKKRSKEKEDKEMGDDAVDQTPVTSALRHVELTLMDKRTSASSDSGFGSFKVCVPVMLVGDLLSGEEWSQFLDNNQKTDPSPLRSNSKDTAQLITTVVHSEEHREAVPVSPEHIYEEIQPYDTLNILAGSQTCVEQKRAVFSAPTIVLETETPPLSPRMRDMVKSVEFIQPPVNTNNMFSDFQSEGVLDTSVQKYLIRLSRKRNRRGPLHRQWLHNKKNEISSQPPVSTSPGNLFTTSVFYNVPCSGGEELPPTVKCGRGSPKPLTKMKMALKDKNLLRADQPKEGRGK